MITKEQTYALVNKFKSHTESVVKTNQKQFLPVFNTGKIFNTKRYHYLDRWYGYAFSADEPEKTYSIIYVENMPYRTLYKRGSTKSFTTSIERMIYDKELVPFLLFINNRFVPWHNIDIIHDCDDTYLKIHGEKYNYYAIGDIKMLVIPYNISYVGTEPEYSFNTNFSALCDYINKSATIKNNKLYINLPDTGTDYTYERFTYNIGYWMYNQLRLRHLGLLSDNRINKLRSISVQKTDGINAFTTTVNLFDRDSYIAGAYDTICNIDADNVLFRFNNNGELDNNGEHIIYFIDKDEIDFNTFTFTGNIYYGDEKSNTNTFFKENYFIFKNGCICNDCNIIANKYNSFKISDIDKTEDYNIEGKKITNTENNECVVYRISSNTDTIICHNYKFPNRLYVADKYIEYVNTGIDNTGYMDTCTEPLDFSISNDKVYEDNFSDAFDAVLNYNPMLFNELYDKDIISKSYTGAEANKFISIIHNDRYTYTGDADINGNPSLEVIHIDRRGLQIYRNSIKGHEFYAIIFLNGEVIDTYKDMIVSSNYVFIPRENDFKDTDIIEVVYFLNVNNNELPLHNFYSYNNDYSNIIPENNLKIFSTEVEDILTYKEPDYDLNNISFPVYKRSNDHIVLIDEITNPINAVAVSSNKFVYQNLIIDRKTYKVLLDKRFRYCDNQKQYCLFINGRKIPQDKYLITIPSISRPFDRMYIYSAKFFKPTDIIDLFYLPTELADINASQDIKIKTNGYIECNKTILNYPLDPEYYMFFVNGKKIPASNILNVSTNMVRITKDTNTTDALNIYPMVSNEIQPVKEYLKSDNISKYESLIDYIKNNDSLGYEELDALFLQAITISNMETPLNAEVARIAIINEIVRDFWVTSGYDYNAKPFVYDYELDDYITKDDNGNYIIPALDALPEINIIKYDLHYLSFTAKDANHEIFTSRYFEYGDIISNPIFEWQYNDNYNTEEIEYQRLNDIDIPIEDDYEYSYQLEKEIHMTDEDNVFKLESSNGFNICTGTIEMIFSNAIYYGLVDEDLLDQRDSDIYHNNPSQLLNDITKIIKPEIKLDLRDYIIGNNKYFIYAAPKRLVYNDDGKLLITFYLPDINSDEVKAANNDDKTMPILTNGAYTKETVDPEFSGELLSLDKYSMEIMTEFNYTNIYGYTEDYVIFKSNGFFTRLYDDTKFTINIR